MSLIGARNVVSVVGLLLWASGTMAASLVSPVRRAAPPVPPALFRAAKAARTAAEQAGEESLFAGLPVSPLSSYTPPACVPGVPFSDVTCTTFFDPYIEQLFRDGITTGCGGGMYCPSAPVTRDQMALFVEHAIRGTGSWPPHIVTVYHREAAEPDSNANSGAELISMVAAIPSSGDEAPGQGNPWLVRLGPGICDLGTSTLQLPAYVSLEGAGEDSTAIEASGYSLSGYGTLMLSGISDVHDIGVYNLGGNTYDIAIVVAGSDNQLVHVTAIGTSSSDATGTAVGIYAGSGSDVTVKGSRVFTTVQVALNTYGVESVGSVVGISDTAIFAGGASASGASYGAYCSGGALSVTNGTTIEVSDGAQPVGIHIDGTVGTNIIRDSLINVFDDNTVGALDLDGGDAILQDDDLYSYKNAVRTSGSASIEINNSRVVGLTTWITNGAGATAKAGASLLSGTTNNAGTLTCGGNYSSSYAPLGNACP